MNSLLKSCGSKRSCDEHRLAEPMSISMPTAIEGDRRELTWTKIGGHGVLGSWDDDYVRSIRSAFVHEGQIYVTAFGSKEMGSAAIWKFDGSSWSRIFLAADHRLPFNRFGSVLQIGNQFIVGTGWRMAKGARPCLFSSRRPMAMTYATSGQSCPRNKPRIMFPVFYPSMAVFCLVWAPISVAHGSRPITNVMVDACR